MESSKGFFRGSRVFLLDPCRSPRIPDSQAVSLSAARLGMVCERQGNPVTGSDLFAQKLVFF